MLEHEGPPDPDSVFKKLQLVRSLARLDRDDEPGAWRLAYAATHIAESMREYLAAIDRFSTLESLADVEDALGDLREAIRHIAYHIQDCEFFSELLDPDLIRPR